jgi:hypothetical protein
MAGQSSPLVGAVSVRVCPRSIASRPNLARMVIVFAIHLRALCLKMPARYNRACQGCFRELRVYPNPETSVTLPVCTS